MCISDGSRDVFVVPYDAFVGLKMTGIVPDLSYSGEKSPDILLGKVFLVNF